MKLSGWSLIQSDHFFLIRRGTLVIHRAPGLCKHRGKMMWWPREKEAICKSRRWASEAATSQTPWSQTYSLQTGRKYISIVEATQSMVFVMTANQHKDLHILIHLIFISVQSGRFYFPNFKKEKKKKKLSCDNLNNVPQRYPGLVHGPCDYRLML